MTISTQQLQIKYATKKMSSVRMEQRFLVKSKKQFTDTKLQHTRYNKKKSIQSSFCSESNIRIVILLLLLYCTPIRQRVPINDNNIIVKPSARQRKEEKKKNVIRFMRAIILLQRHESQSDFDLARETRNARVK